MIHDTLDLMNPKQRETLSGRYYKSRPISPDDGAESFNYEFVNPFSKTWRNMFGNIQTASHETAIRTDDMFAYGAKAGESYVLLQDGGLFQILQVSIDYESAPKQAFRLLPVPMGTKYILRLLQIENPWEIQ